MAKVLGVDPGMHETGWAVLDGAPGAPRLLASGVIRTKPGVPLPDRLKEIHAELSAVLAEHRPESCAIEEMFFCFSSTAREVTANGKWTASRALACAS